MLYKYERENAVHCKRTQLTRSATIRVYLSSQNGTCIYARLLPLFPNAAVSEAKQVE